ncbi:MAG: type II secretion system protein M [Burkholderiales bacterium]|nr:type II secretion system protein M [Burkholderiales bacterium]
MKEQWEQLSRRYAALSLRERLIILVGAVVVTALLFDALLLDPLAASKRRLTQQIAEARTSIQAAENALRQHTAQDPAAAKRALRDSLRGQIRDIDSTMQGLQKDLVPPEQMAKLLDSVLARSRGLTLVGLRKLPVQRFETRASGTAQKPAAGKPAAEDTTGPGRSLYQHTVELTIQGSYADLHDYLVRLEKLPWQMYWGRLRVDAEHHPRLTLTLTVHTLSLSKEWLTV